MRDTPQLAAGQFIKGWIDMAIKEFRKALNINPDFSDVGFKSGIVLQITKKAQGF